MYLHFWKDDVPEVIVPNVIIHCNIHESIADLGVTEVFVILLEDEGVILAIIGALQSSVDLMENVVVHIIEIIVSSLVDLSSL